MTSSNFLLIFSLLHLAFAGSHVTLTKEELYWKSVFPNTPIPKVLQDILPRSGKVDLESEGVNEAPNFAYFNDYRYNWDYDYNIWDAYYDRDYNEDDYSDDEDYAYNNNDYNYAPAPSIEFGGHDDHAVPNNQRVNDPKSRKKHSLGRQNNYRNISDIKETIYFFQEALHPGKELNLPRLTERSDKTLFLSQQIAKSMSMSRDKLYEILKTFSLKNESSYADNVRSAIRSCERARIRGEEKYYATSLESFIDFSVLMLGKNIKLLSHQLGKGPKNPLFTIAREKRDIGDNNIVCHKMRCPYAAYLCHFIKNTTLYEVTLVSMDGIKVNALAVCHKDTAGWSPKHISFLFLKVKPGTVPICHFVNRDTVIWVSN